MYFKVCNLNTPMLATYLITLHTLAVAIVTSKCCNVMRGNNIRILLCVKKDTN